jgi:hypothetical protein
MPEGSGSMSDVAKWKLRGRVRTLRIEHAEWDAAREAWKPPRGVTLVTFQPDGKMSSHESHAHDGRIGRITLRYDDRGRLLEVQREMTGSTVSKSIYSYDQAGRHLRTVNVDSNGSERESESVRYDSTGRKTKVSFLESPALNVPFAIDIPGTDQPVSVHAAEATTMTTTYGERDLPEEVLLHDANHTVVRRVVFTRDRDGRVLSEEVRFGGQFPFPELEKDLSKRPPEEAAQLAAVISNVFARQTLHATEYAYDRHGRVLEKSMRMGTLGETRTTFRYDDRDNPIEEIQEDQNREVGADADGTLRTRNEKVQRHYGRFEYQYDSEGNWTERIVSNRLEPSPTFQRTNVERRQITYYASA